MLGALVEEVCCQTENDDCEDELRSAQLKMATIMHLDIDGNMNTLTNCLTLS